MSNRSPVNLLGSRVTVNVHDCSTRGVNVFGQSWATLNGVSVAPGWMMRTPTLTTSR
jgi:hypothetical protein